MGADECISQSGINRAPSLGGESLYNVAGSPKSPFSILCGRLWMLVDTDLPQNGGSVVKKFILARRLHLFLPFGSSSFGASSVARLLGLLRCGCPPTACVIAINGTVSAPRPKTDKKRRACGSFCSTNRGSLPPRAPLG